MIGGQVLGPLEGSQQRAVEGIAGARDVCVVRGPRPLISKGEGRQSLDPKPLGRRDRCRHSLDAENVPEEAVVTPQGGHELDAACLQSGKQGARLGNLKFRSPGFRDLKIKMQI
jgi:hypothetical protein